AALRSASRAALDARPPAPGLRVCGYLLSEIGIGQSARAYALAARAAGIPLSGLDLPLPGRANAREFADLAAVARPRRTQLFVQGISEAPATAARLRRMPRQIACTPWELARLAPARAAALDAFDELWAPSRFVAEALAERARRPVHLVRHPLPLAEAPPPARAGDGVLRIQTFFDTDSYAARKNPQAAVRAFRAAFAPARRDVALTVKLRGATDAGERAWLAEAAAQDGRITVIDRTLSRAEMDAMADGSDAFLSLHRSEGFGLGPAEALARAKAVIATDYSATTDFVTPDTGYPVPAELAPLAPGDYPDGEGQVWAEPSIEAAAAALNAIYYDPAEARRRGEAGFALLKANHGFDVVGARMKALLDA
ncbi:MAG: glycosyltransferase, partial [Pseudomonadota bacterium]